MQGNVDPKMSLRLKSSAKRPNKLLLECFKSEQNCIEDVFNDIFDIMIMTLMI